MRKSLKHIPILLISASLGIAVPMLSTDFPVNKVYAEEISVAGEQEQRQEAIREVQNKRDEVLDKLRQLTGNEEAKSILDQRFYWLADLNNDSELVAHLNKRLKQLDTELFKISLLEEVYNRLKAYNEQTQSEQRFNFLDLYRGVPYIEQELPRYSFAEVGMLDTELLAQLNWLAVLNDETSLIRYQHSILSRLTTLEASIEEFKPVRDKYNELIRYFNNQPEEVRKQQYHDFMADAVQKLSYTVSYKTSFSPAHAESGYIGEQAEVLNRLNRLEHRIKGQLLTSDQLQRIQAELDQKKADSITKLQTLPHINFKGKPELLDVNDYRYTTVGSSNAQHLPEEITAEEAEAFKANKLENWDKLLYQMTLMSDRLEALNQLNDRYQLGHEYDFTFVTEVHAFEAKPVSPMPSRVLTTDEFIAEHISVSKHYLRDIEKGIHLIGYEPFTDESYLNQLANLADQKLAFWTKKLETEQELVTIYNKIIDKINQLPKEQRHKVWLELIYPKKHRITYLVDAIALESVTDEASLTVERSEILELLTIFESRLDGLLNKSEQQPHQTTPSEDTETASSKQTSPKPQNSSGTNTVNQGNSQSNQGLTSSPTRAESRRTSAIISTDSANLRTNLNQQASSGSTNLGFINPRKGDISDDRQYSSQLSPREISISSSQTEGGQSAQSVLSDAKVSNKKKTLLPKTSEDKSCLIFAGIALLVVSLGLIKPSYRL
ncbi:hypothetical protein ABID29_001648 [Streptococcus rupicaprae]|uniref:LPXTG cell wall anchor domain-containing protein n=1 Tax=Streptococcus rupicaprae TaxID=759619 RepID=A0ABV2FJ19_9STRE